MGHVGAFAACPGGFVSESWRLDVLLLELLKLVSDQNLDLICLCRLNGGHRIVRGALDSSRQVSKWPANIIIVIQLTLRTSRRALTPHRLRLVIQRPLILVGQHLGRDALLPRRISG